MSMDHTGLTLTYCDCCGKRQFCAVEGTAFCRDCCPGAVQDAQDKARRAIQAAEQALWEDELLPGEYDGPPVPFAKVAHLFPHW